MALDWTNRFYSILNEAEAYGREMEQLFDEPNEYTTSKYEVIEGCFDTLFNEWQQNDGENIVSITMPQDAVHEIRKRHSNEVDLLLSLFPNATIEYI
jgi:hypothetical protein